MVDGEEVILDGFFPILNIGISQTSQRSELDTIPTVSIQNSDDLVTLTPLVAEVARYVDAEYPEYLTLQSRIASFEGWTNEKMSPIKSAEAGFMYSKKSDIVACFHCGVHVGDWVKEDDAWTSHAKFSPWCTFIYIKQGLRFIDSCLKGVPLQSQSSPIIEPTIDRYKCKVCLEKEIGVCFYPCDHSVTCIDCAPGIASCPICRKEISGVFRLKLIN